MADLSLTDEQRYDMRHRAESSCTHEDEWVSGNGGECTPDACWGCLLDAYFTLRTGDEDE